MPLVLINRDPLRVPDDHILEITPKIARVFVEVLQCKEASLDIREIEVRIRDVGRLDFGASPLGIEVLANHYPSRAENIQQRTEFATKKIRDRKLFSDDLIGTSSFVWITLAHAGFASL